MRFREGCEERRREGWIFLLWHPSGGTTASDFHFRGRTQGSLSYGHDNKRCFTAHDVLCLSISLRLYDDSLPACLAVVFSRPLLDHCVRLPICLFYSESVRLSARPDVILCLSLYTCQAPKKYNVIPLPLPSTTCSDNRFSVQFLANVTHSYDLFICCFQPPSPSSVFPLCW